MKETLLLASLSYIGEGNHYPLQYSGLENSIDCMVHIVAKSQSWLNDFHFHFLSILKARVETS